MVRTKCDKLVIFIILVSSSVIAQEHKAWNEIIPLYESKSIVLPGKNTGRYVPVISSYLQIPCNLDLKEKLSVLADSLSIFHFNDLEIEIISIDSNDTYGNLLTINLKEPDTFRKGEPRPGFTTWYAFFQGSFQGTDTRIVLIESFLQRYYKGEWIDALQVNYQGEPIYEMDHIDLSGVIRRYK